MFKKPVRILVEIAPVNDAAGVNCDVHTVSITLESGRYIAALRE
jgi:hypothetical protein